MLINAEQMPSLHKVIFKKEYILVARKMKQSLKGSLDLVVFSSFLPPKTISETLVSVFCFVSWYFAEVCVGPGGGTSSPSPFEKCKY